MENTEFDVEAVKDILRKHDVTVRFDCDGETPPYSVFKATMKIQTNGGSRTIETSWLETPWVHLIVNKPDFTPEEVAAEILEEVRYDAQKALGAQ